MSKVEKSADVRAHLVKALEADLVGPLDESGQETLVLSPSRWYLTGFLAPQTGRDAFDDEDADDELGVGNDTSLDEAPALDVAAKGSGYLPASIGMSFLVPAAQSDSSPGELRVWVKYADYKSSRGENDSKVWTRFAQTPDVIVLPLNAVALAEGVVIPNSGNGLRVIGHLKSTGFDSDQLPRGTRAVSLFLVNERAANSAPGEQDAAFVFQVEMTVEASCGFVARPNLRDANSQDWDALVADLQYRDRQEFGVGHGVSVKTIPASGDTLTRLRTTWIPAATVSRVTTREYPGVMVAMGKLAELTDGAAVRLALQPLISGYAAWIEEQRMLDVRGVSGRVERANTRDALMEKAAKALNRIEQGIELLATDPRALKAFKTANLAMEMAARQRSPERYAAPGQVPTWRLFQLAFILMNIASITDDLHEDRDTVELIFFPTGGGKTEAYLGVIAYTLVLRRLRGAQRPDQGLGTAVLLRYTLRLLTLDQLSRAASLICALEVLRTIGAPRRDEKRRQPIDGLGPVRFSIGLWVGRSATANTLSAVAKQITEYKNSTGTSTSTPFPLAECPWCQSAFKKGSFELKPTRTKPEEVVVSCGNYQCEFAAGQNPNGLPVLFVDEQIYKELPSFLVATVDKFALMPWRGEVGKLMGRVHSIDMARDGIARFYSAMDGEPNKAHDPLERGLVPPELIVQDELHLISGPLGTMVGLYETAIEELCTYRSVADNHLRKPKILASTATVKNARHHVHALFGRNDLAIFPPQGIDEGETFFSQEDRGDEDNPIETIQRMYIGVAASGRAMKMILLRTYVALLSAAEYYYNPKGAPDQPADPYMTLVGYFNSLRELGGMRRLVEDDVHSRCLQIEARKPYGMEGAHPWFANRKTQMEPVELTSRESTANITVAKSRLAIQHADRSAKADKRHAVDVVLASNMISVGVDIDRLGLMVVAGQPKTTSEYIQASSRVGRDRARPGLVVTCYNMHKPRDRSHYEHFVAYHESFYRYVEATSLTPFSAPALDRGLAGTLIAMTRHANDSMVRPNDVEHIATNRALAERAVEKLAKRASALCDNTQDAMRVEDSLRQRGRNLIDQWVKVIGFAREDAGNRQYSKLDRTGKGKPLLFGALDEDADERTPEEKHFAAPTSMRDVEPSVHVWVYRRGLKKGGQDG